MSASSDLTPFRSRGLWRTEAWRLLGLAIPVVLTQLAQRAIGTTDVLMLGMYNAEALGASALGLAIYYQLVFLCYGPSSTMAILVPRMIGRGITDPELHARILRTGLYAALAISIPCALLIQFTVAFLELLREPLALARQAGLFAATIGTSLPFVVGFDVLRHYAASLDRPQLPLIAIFASIAANATADYVLIFGHLGAPELGLWGAALASVIANACSFAALALLIGCSAAIRPRGLLKNPFAIDREAFIAIFRLGGPIGLTLLLEVLFFTSGALILGYFGGRALAAHQIANTIIATVFLVPMGLGTSATIRIGYAIGTADLGRARRVSLLALAMGAAFSAACGALMATAPEALISLLIPLNEADPELVRQATLFLYFAAAFQILDSIQVVASSLLRGLADTFIPMLLAAISYWLIGFPAAVGLCFWLGWGGAGVWAAYTVALLAAALALSIRLAIRLRRLDVGMAQADTYVGVGAA